jgi:uncharacterized Rossmann fold enzyme
MTQQAVQILPPNIPDLAPRQIRPDVDVPVNHEEYQSICYSSTPPQYSFSHQNFGDQPTHLQENLQSIPEIKRMQFLYTIGFDDGEYIQAVLDQLPQSSTLLCIEPWPELFYKILATKDVSKILSDPRFDIVVGLQPSTTKLEQITARIANFESFQELKKPHSFLKHGLDFSTHLKKILDLMLEAIKMKATMKRTSDLSVKWYLENTATGIRCGDLNHLRSEIQGKPYIAVGMGPSLDSQIKILKKVQHKAIIGVTDNALRELLDAGIDPDIVFHVEWRIESLAFYQNLKFRKPATLCYLQGVHPKIIETWPYYKAAYPAEQINLIFGPLTQSQQWQGFFGTTVGDLAIQFGANCNATEIFLLGMDSSCPAGSYHHPNTAAMREIYGETNRFWSPEKWDWRHVYHEPQRVLTENWSGEKVYSHASFKKGINVVATIAKRLQPNQSIYSTSDYGAKLDAELRSLNTLESYPNIKKELKPSQNLVSNHQVQELLRERRKQTRRYFENIKELKIRVMEYIKEMTTPSKKFDIVKQSYLNTLNAFQSDADVAWVEKFVILLDGTIAIRSGRDRHRLRDENDESIIEEKAKMFADYIDCMLAYENVIKNHLRNIQKEFSNVQ